MRMSDQERSQRLVRDRERARANSLANNNPEKLIIEYDCGHAGAKEKHHLDYTAPYNVELLCTKCHGETHAETGLKLRVARSFLALIFRVSAMQVWEWERSSNDRSLTTTRLIMLAEVLCKKTDDFFVEVAR